MVEVGIRPKNDLVLEHFVDSGERVGDRHFVQRHKQLSHVELPIRVAEEILYIIKS